MLLSLDSSTCATDTENDKAGLCPRARAEVDYYPNEMLCIEERLSRMYMYIYIRGAGRAVYAQRMGRGRRFRSQRYFSEDFLRGILFTFRLCIVFRSRTLFLIILIFRSKA